MLAVMGVDPIAFWLGQILADLTLIAVPIIGTWIALAAFDLTDFLHAGFEGPRSGPGFFFIIESLFALEITTFSHAFSHAFTSPAFAITLIPAACLGLLVLPVLCLLLALQFDQMTHSDPSDRLQMREIFSMLLMLWAALSPQGFLLASTILLVFPHIFSKDHSKYYIGLFSEDLSPMWAMCLLSFGKSIAFAWMSWWMDVKNLRPLPPPSVPFSTPPQVVAALDDDVRREYEIVNASDGGDAEGGLAVGGSGRMSAIEYKHLRKVIILVQTFTHRYVHDLRFSPFFHVVI
jgi:hypothetical protein